MAPNYHGPPLRGPPAAGWLGPEKPATVGPMDASPAPRARLRAAMLLLSMVAGGAALSAGFSPGSAAAQASEPPPQAIELYRSGREHYRAGRYHEAIHDLKAALELDPESPNLIYNVAKVNESLGNLDEAIDYYRHYLELLPGSETEERDRIRETISRLEGARDEVKSHVDSEPDLREWNTPPPPPPPAPGRADAMFWITGGTGVALLAAAAVTGVLAVNREQDVQSFVIGPDGDVAERQALSDKADRLATTTDILWISGATAVTTAVLLYFLRDAEQRPAVQASVATNGRSASFTLAGTF